MRFKRVIQALLVLLAAGFGAGEAAAQSSYPSKPIRLIVTFSAGGPADVIARLLGEKIAAELGQTVLVENRTGGSSVIGTQAAARSEPDGYTVLQITAANIIAVQLLSNVPYDFEKDFVPVIGIGAVPNVLAVPGKANIRSVPDLVNAAQSMPGGLNYASGGNGSLGHLSGALLVQELKIKATHVPYRGNSPAMQDLMTNRVQLFFPTIIEGLAAAKTGDVRLLAVTSEQRLASAPDLPTMKELGLGHIDPRTWYGYLVPAKTPPAIVDRLHDAISKAVTRPDVQERLKAFSFQTVITTGPQFRDFMRAESGRWKKVIQDNGIKSDTQ
jgi:tripartite-type tricarboxylate transporter receptor subunit TctC